MFFITLSFVLHKYVVPAAKNSDIGDTNWYICAPKLICTNSSAAVECPTNLRDAFAFYAPLLFDRQPPYQLSDPEMTKYEAKIDTVFVELGEIKQFFDFTLDNESYTLVVNGTGIFVKGQSYTSLIRAFASMIQLTAVSGEPKNFRLYLIHAAAIRDHASFGWRHFGVEPAVHYVKLQSLKRVIDIVSLQKLNVLLLQLTDDNSFTLSFENTPQSKLAEGAYSPYHFYDAADLKELQAYAQSRGVVVVPQINLLGRVASWGHAEPGQLAKCEQKGGLSALKPSAQTYSYINGIFEELSSSLFEKSMNIKPTIHLGGDTDFVDCWQLDPDVVKYAQELSLTVQQLAESYFNRIYNIAVEIFGQNKFLLIVDEFSRNLVKKDTTDVALHFTKTTNIGIAQEKNLKSIQSTHWYLNLMHPNGGHHYFWQDTWYNLGSVSLDKRNTLLLGGGAMMPGDNVWDHSIEAHSFDRGLVVAIILWTTLSSQSEQLEYLGCKLYKAGGRSGPLEIGNHCFGYIWKWLDDEVSIYDMESNNCTEHSLKCQGGKVKLCEANYFVNFTKCSACPAEAKCDGVKIEQCGYGKMPDESQKTCVACTITICIDGVSKLCSSYNGEQCNGTHVVKCIPGFLLENGSCIRCQDMFCDGLVITRCKFGSYISVDRKSCYTCSTNSVCDGVIQIECSQLNGSECNGLQVTKCKLDYYLDTLWKCQICPEEAQCNGAEITQCPIGYKIGRYECVQCQTDVCDGRQSVRCHQFDSHAATCDGTKIIQCISGYLIINGKCVFKSSFDDVLLKSLLVSAVALVGIIFVVVMTCYFQRKLKLLKQQQQIQQNALLQQEQVGEKDVKME